MALLGHVLFITANMCGHSIAHINHNEGNSKHPPLVITAPLVTLIFNQQHDYKVGMIQKQQRREASRK